MQMNESSRVKDYLSEIQSIGNHLIASLERLKDLDGKNYQTFLFDCENLEDYNHEDIRYIKEHSSKFEKMLKMEGPVLYWFEIVSDTNNGLIRDKIQTYAQQEGAKATPALKKQFDHESKCLYLGKVKGTFWGRVIQHLGFYKVKRTQGLQLFHWAKGLNLKVKIHAVEFDQSMADLVSILELEMARRLKPITGKHK